MNKALKTILIISVIVSGTGFLFVNSTQAIDNKVWFGDKNIFVNFDELPFDLSNWAPGMTSPSKTITITNGEDFNINVYFKAKKTSGDDILANALTITIDGESNHLSDLFNNNITLGSVNSFGGSQYNSIILSFDEDAGNEYQNKTINFDFVITVKEVGKGDEEIPPVIIPGGGGGGYVYAFTIAPESVRISKIGENSVTITWTTSDFSTSRVIYDTISHPTLGNPPNYGYIFSTPEQDQDPKMTFHSIRIDGLTPGTTYFYRTVSRASPEEVSQQHSFTTKGVAGAETEKEEVGEEEEEEEEEKEEIVEEGGPVPEEGIGEEEEEEEEEEKEEEEEEIVIGEEKEEKGRAGAFLATIGQFFSDLSLKDFLWILLIFAILLLIVLIFSRKRKKEIS